jgi:diguanylate cyclase (GGDEF)-like protein/PAS domain S-box-containing protein
VWDQEALEVLDLLRAVSRARDLQDLGEGILRFALGRISQAQAGSILLWNEFLDRYEFVAAVGWDFEKLRTIAFPKEKIVQRAIYGERPAVIRNILDLNRKLWGSDLAEKVQAVGPVAATLTFPLWAEGEMLGYLNLDHHEDPAAFSEEDLGKLAPYLEIFAGLLEQGRRHEEQGESAALFRVLFERLADAVYITGFDGTIFEANPAAERQTGYSREELLGKNILRDIAAEKPAVTYEEVNERLARGDTVMFEEKKRRKDGTLYWTECAVVQFHYKGRPATLSVNRDITERKRLEEELRRQVDELATLNQALAILTSQLERKKAVQNLVDLAQKLSAADFANVLLLDEEGHVLETIDPLGAPPLPLRLRPKGFTRWILERGEPLVVEEIRSDGTTVPEVRFGGEVLPANPHVVAAGIRSLAGFPLRIRGRVRGVFYVHSRKPRSFTLFRSALAVLAEHAGVALENAELYEMLRTSEERWRTLFEESPVALWLEDFSQVKARLDELRAQGVQDLREHLKAHPELIPETLSLLRVLAVNRATLNLYEVSDREELLRRLPLLIPGEAGPLWAEELSAIWEGRREFSGLGVNRTAKGKILHVLVAWYVLPGHEEDYDHVLVSIHDLTPRVKAEEALRGLNAALAALSSTLDLPEILRMVERELAKLVPFDAFFVAAIEGKKIRPLLAVEEGAELALPELPLDPQASPTAWVAVHGKPLFLEDVERTPPPVPFRQVGRPVRGWACLPLSAQDQVVGVLSVQGFQPMSFGEMERDVLLAFAAGLASTLRNALLHRKVRATAEKLRALEEISRHMKLAQTAAELYEIVLTAVTEILKFKYAAVLEAQGEELVLVAHRGYPSELQRVRLPLVGGKGVPVAAYLANEAVYVPDVRGEPRYVAGLPTLGCELAIPIAIGKKRFGVLNVEHDEIDGITPEDQDLLKILAAELAVALLGLERLEQLRTLSEKLAILHEISQELQRCTTVEEVCQKAVRAMAEKLGFFQVTIDLVQGELLVPVAGVGEISAKARPFRKGEGVAGTVWATGQTIWGNIEDLPVAKPVDPPIRSGITVPIGDRGVMQGVSDRPDAFSPDDVRVMEILARHVYEEIRRVELEEELRQQAIRDPLTGLYNRRFLAEVLQREAARAERYRHPLALVLVDVDNFKDVNDRYGHLVGDEALRRVAKALRENIRRVDYIFRWGGDEFCVVLPETDERGAQEVARRFREPFGPLAEDPVLRLTLGYAVWDPLTGPLPSVDELFRRADLLLFEMKRARPNP